MYGTLYGRAVRLISETGVGVVFTPPFDKKKKSLMENYFKQACDKLLLIIHNTLKDQHLIMYNTFSYQENKTAVSFVVS